MLVSEMNGIRPVDAGRQDCHDLHSWGPGVRQCYIIHYIISGKGTFTCGKKTYTLTAGQKQRAAVARALITNPELVLADEPSGALDSHAADGLMKLFGEINEEGQTIVMVTHSVKAACSAKRVLFIKDGEVFHQLYRGSLGRDEMYQKISDTLTILATGGERDE